MKKLITALMLVVMSVVSAYALSADVALNAAGEVTGIKNGKRTVSAQNDLSDAALWFQQSCDLFRKTDKSQFLTQKTSRSGPDYRKSALLACKAMATVNPTKISVESLGLNKYGVKTTGQIDTGCWTLYTYFDDAASERAEQLIMADLVSVAVPPDYKFNSLQDVISLVKHPKNDAMKEYTPVQAVWNLTTLVEEGELHSPLHRVIAAAMMNDKKGVDAELDKMNGLVNQARAICGGVLLPLPVPKGAYTLDKQSLSK